MSLTLPQSNSLSATLPQSNFLAATLPQSNSLSATLPQSNSLSATLPQSNSLQSATLPKSKSATLPQSNSLSATLPRQSQTLCLPHYRSRSLPHYRSPKVCHTTAVSVTLSLSHSLSRLLPGVVDLSFRSTSFERFWSAAFAALRVKVATCTALSGKYFWVELGPYMLCLFDVGSRLVTRRCSCVTPCRIVGTFA